jgi:uncharacterized membrane protein YhhN
MGGAASCSGASNCDDQVPRRGVLNWGPYLLCAAAVTGLLWAERRGSRTGLWLTKPVASLAFVWAALAMGALETTYGQLVLLGLVLCLLGDLLLIPLERPTIFKAGVFAFLAGHVAYSAAFLTRPLEPLGLAVAAALLAVVLLGVLRWLGSSLPPDMVGPVRTYMLVIGFMSALACGVTAAGGPWAIAAGALAFTASDISVARDRFVRHEFLNRAWGLPLYYAAQLMIATTPALI